MSPYFFVYILVLIFSFFDLATKSNVVKLSLLYLLAIVFVIFSSLRWSVGTDWFPYLYFFDNIKNISIGESGYEVLYEFLQRFVQFFSYNYTSMLLITALIIIGFTYSTIRRYSFYPAISVLMLYAYSINSSGFGYRQDIAIAICFFSFHFIFKRELISFLISVVIASLFHQSAIVFIFAYWYYDIKWTRRYLITLILAIFIGYLASAQLELISGLYSDNAQGKIVEYMENPNENFGDGSNPVFRFIIGLVNRSFLLILPLLIIYKNPNPQIDNLKKLYNLFLLGFIFYIVFGSVSTVFIRFSRYYDMFQILVIPMTLYIAPPKKRIVLFLFLLAYVTFKFCIVMFSDNGVYIPYKTVFYI